MSDREKDAEILTLRHQVRILQRQLGGQRVRCAPALWAALLGTPVNLADYRIRRKTILAGLTHEYQITS